MEEIEITIFVLPTEEGLPPRAIVGASDEEKIMGPMAVFSNDMGCWTFDGQPIPSPLNEAITAHATELGVPGFNE